jgi:TRAP-type C4-dicarboxylate transport system substrate-binding protein
MFTSFRIALVLAVVTLAAGVGTSLAGPPGKTGGTVTLRLADPEPQGRPASLIAESFAARAKALSKGKIVVRIAYEAGLSANIPVGRLEANLIRLVRSGKDELAIVPTRAFHGAGVASFQALQAPFLITTTSAMNRATTGTVATGLQSGLDRISLVGLGLAPEGLRRAFGFKKPLGSLADFAGIRIRAIPSKATWTLLRALGAAPVDLNGDPFRNAVAKGRVQGAESSLAVAADDDLLAKTFTAGNVAFFPKVDALVGNGAALAKLTSKQLSILRRAATHARSWAVSHLTERRARDAFCKGGGTIVNVPPRSIKQLQAKTAPLLREMRRDSVTRRLIARIQSQGASASPLTACTHKSGSSGNRGGPTVSKVIPPGSYRATFKAQEFLDAGATNLPLAQSNAGTWTLTTTADGYQQYYVDSPYQGMSGPCAKRKMYLRNGLVAIELRGGCEGTNFVAWKLVPDGLRFTRVVPADAMNRVLYLSRVWKKVG